MIKPKDITKIAFIFLLFDYDFKTTPKHSAFRGERAFKLFSFRMHAPTLLVKITERVNQASPRKDIDVCVLMVGQVEHVTWVRLKHGVLH